MDRKPIWLRIILIATVLSYLAVLATPAVAVPASFDWGSFDAQGGTGYGVYESDNNTVLPTGALVQLIWAGPDGQIDPPMGDGAPGGDDLLLDSNRVLNGSPLPPPQWNKGYVPLKTYSFDTAEPQNGGTVYQRAWNAESAGDAAAYGDSQTAILSNGGLFNAPRWWVNDEPTAITLAELQLRFYNGVAPALVLLVLVLASCTVYLLARSVHPPKVQLTSFMDRQNRDTDDVDHLES